MKYFGPRVDLDLHVCIENLLKCHELHHVRISIFVSVLLYDFKTPKKIIVSVLLNFEIYPEIWFKTFLHFDLFVGILLNRFDLHVGGLFESVELSPYFVSVLSNCCKSETSVNKYVVFIGRKRASCV